MQKSQPWLIARDDTFLGVCQALGDDFGINPLWLRIGFAVPVLFNPILAIAAYLAVGTAVLASRLLAPDPRRAVPVEESPEAETGEAQGELALEPAGGNDNGEELAAAA
jgi:phage shock protein PspC (stress-responsive transcriptional regulator)